MRILFLDDSARRYDVWWRQNMGNTIAWAETAKEAIRQLEEAPEPFDLATLDHDLDEGAYQGTPFEPTGQDVARHIATMPPERRPRRVKVHSFNPVGAAAMQAILLEAGIEAPWVPFNGRRES